MAYTNPTIAEFKTRFTRDFPFGTTDDKVMDSDITNALGDAGMTFNADLWDDQPEYSLAYLYLTAHYLVTNLRNSSAGLEGKYSWLETSKGVSSVNSSFQIPQMVMDNPIMAMLSKTQYGAKYLEFVIPRVIGSVFCVEGATSP